MPDQKLALIKLQKRMLNADLPRRTVAIGAAFAASLLFLDLSQVTLYLVLFYAADIALTMALGRLAADPNSTFKLRLVQVAAFSAMSMFLMPTVLLWQLPGSTPKIAAMLHIFGGMLSIMLVRAAFLPMTVANSLPLVWLVIVLAYIEQSQIPLVEQLFLGFGVTIFGGYFISTVLQALRINRELALARDAAVMRAETQRRFLTTMSHELRTPLNGILGMAQAMVTGQSAQGAEVIRDSAREMAAIVDDLLDNAAIEAGALRINRKPTHLAPLLSRVEDRWRPFFAAKALTLEVSLAPDMPKAVLIDPLRFVQCLSNLLANALRVTTQGGVSLALTRHPLGLEATVTDTGPGLPSGLEAYLFQPFSAIKLPDVPTSTTTGLGLSITHGLARAMGGDLVFQRPVAGGSCFRLTLAASAAVADLPVAKTETSQDALAGKRVLLVDDIATNLLVLRLFLIQTGAVPIDATSGPAALALMADPNFAPPDAVLMDIRMPGLSGFDTLARMRAMGASFPVIAVSADAAPEERAEAMAHGFDGYLTKPVDQTELYQTLALILAGPEDLLPAQ